MDSWDYPLMRVHQGGDVTGLFDCDNHLYEPADAVTRYLPKDMLDRAITPITLANGEEGLLAVGQGDRLSLIHI